MKRKPPKMSTVPEVAPSPGMSYEYIVLLSGGPDSLSALYNRAIQHKGDAEVRGLGLYFDYGQNTYEEELTTARAYLAEMEKLGMKVDLSVIDISTTFKPFIRKSGEKFPPLLFFGESKILDDFSGHDAIPFRNHLMALHAFAVGQIVGVNDIYIGTGYTVEQHRNVRTWDSKADTFAPLNDLADVRNRYMLGETGKKRKEKFLDIRGDQVFDPHVICPGKKMTREKWLKQVEKKIQKENPTLSLANSWSCAIPPLKKYKRKIGASKVDVLVRVPCGVCPNCHSRYALFPEWKKLDVANAIKRQVDILSANA